MACGSFGRPGIRRIGPAITTIISAPVLIGRETVLRFSDADGEVADAQFADALDGFLCSCRECHAACSIGADSHGFHLALDAVGVGVGELERL